MNKIWSYVNFVLTLLSCNVIIILLVIEINNFSTFNNKTFNCICLTSLISKIKKLTNVVGQLIKV